MKTLHKQVEIYSLICAPNIRARREVCIPTAKIRALPVFNLRISIVGFKSRESRTTQERIIRRLRS